MKDRHDGFLIQGSIYAASGIISSIIGLMYRLPLTRIIGDEGNGYYSAAFSNGVAGGKGYGGSTNSNREGGGGSGLYGGGSGGVNHSIVGSGAGGSSFISGHPGCSTVSGYSFTSTQMIDGKGLSWTSAGQTTGGSAVQMPTTSGGLEALNSGHSGHGYAKISSQ